MSVRVVREFRYVWTCPHCANESSMGDVWWFSTSHKTVRCTHCEEVSRVSAVVFDNGCVVTIRQELPTDGN